VNAKKCEVAETLKAVVMSGMVIQVIRAEQPVNWQNRRRNNSWQTTKLELD